MDTQEILFTPSSLLDLLSKVDELKEYPVGLTETFDGGLELLFILLKINMQVLMQK